MDRVARLLKAIDIQAFSHEQGEPFETCLALHKKLSDWHNCKITLTISELNETIVALKNEWDNVQMARSRALGDRISESWLKSSAIHNEFIKRLDLLGAQGIPQVELDQYYIVTVNSVLHTGDF